MCDACGKIASSSDPTDYDPTSKWWELSRGPCPGGVLHLSAPTWLLDSIDDPPRESEPIEEAEPTRHFCSEFCLREWITGRRALTG